MESAIPSQLSAWESFYVIVGSASAVLIGLQFVVIVLGAEMNLSMNDSATRVFGTPTIVHFCAVLFVSLVLSAPWPALGGIGIVLGVCAVAGLVYGVRVIQHARRLTVYTPVLEDWVWHGALPPLAYAALLIAAILLNSRPATAFSVTAGTAILLLFIGIHNSWDSVIYTAHQQAQDSENDNQ